MKGLMRNLVFILLSYLSLTASGQILPDTAFHMINATQGLGENRVRMIRPLEDGRIAFATAAMVCLYQGNQFHNIKLNLQAIYPLTDYHAHRRMYVTNEYLWIKSTHALSAIYLPTNECVTNLQTIWHKLGFKHQATNFFLDKYHRYWLTDSSRNLYRCKEGEEPTLFTQIHPADSLEELAATQKEVALCYRSGKVVVYNIQTRKQICTSNPFSHTASIKLAKHVQALWHNGALWIAHSTRDKKMGFIHRFDLRQKTWHKELETDGKINEFAFINDTLLLCTTSKDLFQRNIHSAGTRHYASLYATIGNEVQPIKGEFTAIGTDSYGGLWIGTLEQGVLYRNPKRNHPFLFCNESYAHARHPEYVNERARRLARLYANQKTNCTYIDSRGTLYLGTRDGLYLVGKDDKIITLITQQDGLSVDNVIALMEDRRGDMWITTSNGLSRLHTTRPLHFELASFNELDGLDLRGGDFKTRAVYKDSLGLIHLGFALGCYTFNPDSLHAPRYLYHLPQTTAQASPVSNTYIFMLLGLGILLTSGFFFRSKRLKRLHARNNQKEKQQTLETNKERILQIKTEEIISTDELFLDKLRQLLETNLDNKDLSVTTLSEMMAMDRTVLYRRMQALTGLTPSAYIKQVRMNTAARLLKEGKYTVTEVSHRVGFSTSRYFSTVFKETFGKTPAEYRK